jgi:hypothetical protein
MQTISNILCKQNNLNADKSEAFANMNGRDYLEDLAVKKRMLLKCSFKKLGRKVWSQSDSTGTSDTFLGTW